VRFIYQDAFSVKGAVQAMAAVLQNGNRGRYIAGGTDLIPRIKRSIVDPDYVISLKNIPGLDRIIEDEQAIHIGALASLKEVASSDIVQKYAPAVAQAAGKAAAPVLRSMGTIGGNIMQDRRCCYYNQSLEWHEGWPPCYGIGKGRVCHRDSAKTRCERVLMSDLVPALILVGAKADIAGERGLRTVLLEDIIDAGTGIIALPLPNLITAITIGKKQASAWKEAYARMSVRKTIDFPEISIALAMQFDARSNAVTDVEIVVGAATPGPFRSKEIKHVVMHPIDSNLGELLGETVIQEIGPLVVGTPNFSQWYKTEMIKVMIKRLVNELRASEGV